MSSDIVLDLPRERRRTGWWSRFETGPVLTLAAILFTASTLIMLAEGLSRSLRGVSYFWAEEAVRYLMVWAFFLTLGAAGRRGLHIRTEMIVDATRPRMRRALHLIAIACGVTFAGVLLAASVPQLVRYYTMGMMSESNLDIPQWVIFLAMPLGAVLWLGYYLSRLANWWKGGDPFAPIEPSSGTGDSQL